MLILGGKIDTSAQKTVMFRKWTSEGWACEWIDGPSLNFARSSHTTNELNNAVIVVGGSSDSGLLSSIEVLNNEYWTTATFGELPSAVRMHSSASVGNRLFICGGETDEVRNFFNLSTQKRFPNPLILREFIF